MGEYKRQLGVNPDNFKLNRPPIGAQGQFDETLGQANYAELMGGQQQPQAPPSTAQAGYAPSVGKQGLLEMLQQKQQGGGFWGGVKDFGKEFLGGAIEGVASKVDPQGYQSRMANKRQEGADEARLMQEFMEQTGMFGREEMRQGRMDERSKLSRESAKEIAEMYVGRKGFQRELYDIMLKGTEEEKEAAGMFIAASHKDKAGEALEKLIKILTIDKMGQQIEKGKQDLADAPGKKKRAETEEERKQAKEEARLAELEQNILGSMLKAYEKPGGKGYDEIPPERQEEVNRVLTGLGIPARDFTSPTLWQDFRGKGTHPTRQGAATTATTTIPKGGGLGHIYTGAKKGIEDTLGILE